MSRDRILAAVVLFWALGAIGWVAMRAQNNATPDSAPIVMPASKSDAGGHLPPIEPSEPSEPDPAAVPETIGGSENPVHFSGSKSFIGSGIDGMGGLGDLEDLGTPEETPQQAPPDDSP